MHARTLKERHGEPAKHLIREETDQINERGEPHLGKPEPDECCDREDRDRARTPGLKESEPPAH